MMSQESFPALVTKVLGCSIVGSEFELKSRYNVHFWGDTLGRCPWCNLGDTRGVIFIVVGNGHGDTSSNPGRD